MLLVTGLLTGLALLTGCDSMSGLSSILVTPFGSASTWNVDRRPSSMTKASRWRLTGQSSGAFAGARSAITMDNQGRINKAVAGDVDRSSAPVVIIGPVSDGLFALTLPVADHQRYQSGSMRCDR